MEGGFVHYHTEYLAYSENYTEIPMNDYLKRIILSVNAIQHLKKMRMLNSDTAKMILADPERTGASVELAVAVSKMFRAPFEYPDENVGGPINFARTENNLPVGLFPDDYSCLIAGMPGTGKTTLLLRLFSQAMIFGIKCWLFSKAPDLRSLLKIDRNTYIASFNEIIDESKINPLEPAPNMTTGDCSMMISDIFQSAGRFWPGTKGFLITQLNELYKKFEGTGHYPSFYDLYEHLEKFKVGKEYRLGTYRDGILVRLGALLSGPLAKVFDCSRGNLKDFIDLNIIFEIIFFNLEQQVFLTNYLLSYLYSYKMLNETQLNHWVAIDDANTVFDAASEYRPDLGLPMIHNLMTTVRKNRINIFACTQTPNQVGSSIHSNSFTKIMFALANGNDIDCMVKGMGIREPEQIEFCHRLKKEDHNVIVKFAGRYTEPFLASIPEVII